MRLEIIRNMLSAVLSAVFTVEEIRYLCSTGLVSSNTFAQGELVRGYLPQREYGQKLTRALTSRIPPADNMDAIMEIFNNLKASVTTVHSQGQIGKDGILDTVADAAFTAVDEVFEAVRFLGLAKQTERLVIDTRTGEKLQSSDISALTEIEELLPWLSSPFSFTDDTTKFGKLVNRDGSSRDPFYPS